jgi:Holliday junction resolvasome RuvABC endonuclease subunit
MEKIFITTTHESTPSLTQEKGNAYCSFNQEGTVQHEYIQQPNCKPAFLGINAKCSP